MFQQRLPAVRLGARHLQMFRGNSVADGAGFFHAARQDQGPAVVQRLGDDGSAGHVIQKTIDGGLDFSDVGRIGTEQNALRQLVVLGLAEQVHRHPFGRRAAIGQDQNFRRPCDHVDADRAKDPLFSAGHIGVAGPGDFVDLGHGSGAVSQSADGLCTAQREGAAHTGHIGGGQHEGIFFATRGGHDHDDVFNTRHMRGNGIHQHAGRVSCFAAGHINTDTVQGRDFLAEQRAVFITVVPALAAGAFLCLVVVANALGRLLQSGSLNGWQALKSRFQFSLG